MSKLLFWLVYWLSVYMLLYNLIELKGTFLFTTYHYSTYYNDSQYSMFTACKDKKAALLHASFAYFYLL